MKCQCRFCGAIYLEHKSRSDWKGYCSQRCMKAMAKRCGYSPKRHRSEYDVLKLNKLIGSVFV